MRRPLVIAISAAALVAAAGVAFATLSPVPAPDAATPSATARTPNPPRVSDHALRALPEADYAAVIPGLIGHDRVLRTAKVETIDRDLPLFGKDRTKPIARLAAHDFLDDRTTVVVVRDQGPWSLVLTPSRKTLPSKAGDRPAPAQTAAWTPSVGLGGTTTPTQRIEISVSRQELRILDADGTATATFPAAVGTEDTPTPTGVTGCLEQRYVDPSQGTGDHPIQLSSLHATAADEPFGGTDGGLIGLHWNPTTSSAVSHGCVRLGADAVAAVDALPLGTLVTITP